MREKRMKKSKLFFGTKLPRKRFAKTIENKTKNEGKIGLFLQIGSELQARRVNLGLTQKRMGELCNLQVATVAKIEKGDLGVKLGTLQIYLDTLNLTFFIKEVEEL